METVKKFAFGGISGMMATCVVQPLDLIKTRLQLSGEGGSQKVHRSTMAAITNIIKQEGIKNLYKGLTAGLFRQATYTTTRMGVYDSAFQYLKSWDGKISFAGKLLAGMIAGGIGAFIGTPAEVALIRMTSDGRLPIEKRRNYRHVFDALSRVSKEEGVLTMWRGCSPTVVRAMILNAVQLGVYSQSKEMLLATGKFKDGLFLHSITSLISGFWCTVVSLPVDITKTRIQTMTAGQYKGAIDCVVKTVQKEGVLSLWKGFTPYFLRLGPHTILTFVILEQFNKTFSKSSI